MYNADYQYRLPLIWCLDCNILIFTFSCTYELAYLTLHEEVAGAHVHFTWIHTLMWITALRGYLYNIETIIMHKIKEHTLLYAIFKFASSQIRFYDTAVRRALGCAMRFPAVEDERLQICNFKSWKSRNSRGQFWRVKRTLIYCSEKRCFCHVVCRLCMTNKFLISHD